MSESVVHFWDLRYEVDQAQRYAELLAERDRLRAVVDATANTLALVLDHFAEDMSEDSRSLLSDALNAAVATEGTPPCSSEPSPSPSPSGHTGPPPVNPPTSASPRGPSGSSDTSADAPRQLDVSADMGGDEIMVTPEEMGNPDWYAYPEAGEDGSTRASDTCRWCNQPIALLPPEELSIAESAWAHVGPQVGTGRRNQVQCEPDMQSMKAEPTDGSESWDAAAGEKP